MFSRLIFITLLTKEIDKGITKHIVEYKGNYTSYNSVNKTRLDLIPYYDKLNRQLSMQSLNLTALDYSQK